MEVRLVFQSFGLLLCDFLGSVLLSVLVGFILRLVARSHLDMHWPGNLLHKPPGIVFPSCFIDQN